MCKKELRKHIREAKRQHTATQLDEMSTHIMQHLWQHPRVQAAHTIMLYHSLPDEPCTHKLAERLRQVGKTVLMPKVTGATSMELRVYDGPDTLTIGSFGILEPDGTLFTDYAAIDTAVIPGMAFDPHGNRLGRGKGYYDRLLPLAANAYKIGVCFAFQMLDNVPADAHDIRMDEVLAL